MFYDIMEKSGRDGVFFFFLLINVLGNDYSDVFSFFFLFARGALF